MVIVFCESLGMSLKLSPWIHAWAQNPSIKSAAIVASKSIYAFGQLCKLSSFRTSASNILRKPSNSTISMCCRLTSSGLTDSFPSTKRTVCGRGHPQDFERLGTQSAMEDYMKERGWADRFRVKPLLFVRGDRQGTHQEHDAVCAHSSPWTSYVEALGGIRGQS